MPPQQGFDMFEPVDDVAPIGTVITNQNNIRGRVQQPARQPVRQPPRQPAQAPPLQQRQTAQPPQIAHRPAVAVPPQPPPYSEQVDSTVIRDEQIILAQRQAQPAPKKPEAMPDSWAGPELKVLVEQFEFYFKQEMYEAAEKLLSDTESHARQLTWWKARRVVMDAIPADKRFPSPKVESEDQGVVGPDPVSDTEPPVDSGKSEELETWIADLEAMIAEGKGRKAMNRIRKDLSTQTDIKWGMGAIDLMEKIWQDLGLQGFKWEPGDGMSLLIKRLKKTPTCKVGDVGQSGSKKES